MDAEQSLEAVTVDPAKQSVSVATMGSVGARDQERLSQKVSEIIQSLQPASAAKPSKSCGLLTGAHDCTACDAPLPPSTARRVEVAYDHGITTVRQIGRAHV